MYRTPVARRCRALKTKLECTNLRIAIGVCKAVERMHEHGLLHLDLKPQNVFMQGLEPRVSCKDALTVCVTVCFTRVRQPATRQRVAPRSPETPLARALVSFVVCSWRTLAPQSPYQMSLSVALVQQQCSHRLKWPGRLAHIYTLWESLTACLLCCTPVDPFGPLCLHAFCAPYMHGLTLVRRLHKPGEKGHFGISADSYALALTVYLLLTGEFPLRYLGGDFSRLPDEKV